MISVIVTGYMVRHPVPGNVYAFLHYVAGLRRLGHHVLYLEESGWDGSCYNPVAQEYTDDPAVGLWLTRKLMARHRLGDVPVAFVNRSTGHTWGLSPDDLRNALRECDLLLDVGGTCWLPEFRLARRRALVDMDPLFTQAGRFAEAVDEHQVHFTYGLNVGRADCGVPTDVEWIPTVPPVVPTMWRIGVPPPDAPLTTVANWSAYGGIELDGVHYGQKDEEFLRIADVPRLSGSRVVVALAGGDERVEKLRSGGWEVVNAGRLTGMRAYRNFLARSVAELSPAKHAYVAARTGWFSDRTVCYLAAGRPAIVQDTGIGDHIDAGAGLLTFTTPDEAVERVEQVLADRDHHARAARRLSRRVFSTDVVLPRLLAAAGVAT